MPSDHTENPIRIQKAEAEMPLLFGYVFSVKSADIDDGRHRLFIVNDEIAISPTGR